MPFKLSDDDIKLLLVHLSRSNIAFSSPHPTLKHCTVLKFRGKRASKPFPLNKSDFGIVSLKSTISSLHKQVESLHSAINQAQNLCKESIKAENRERSRYALRKKKMLEKVLGTRLSNLEGIESIYEKILSSESDADVLSSYESGAGALKDLMKRNDLNVERVENVMDFVAEVLADQAEVEQAISASKVPDSALDSLDSLESELDALIKIDEMEKELDSINKEAASFADMLDAPKVPVMLGEADARVIGFTRSDSSSDLLKKSKSEGLLIGDGEADAIREEKVAVLN